MDFGRRYLLIDRMVLPVVPSEFLKQAARTHVTLKGLERVEILACACSALRPGLLYARPRAPYFSTLLFYGEKLG